MKTLQTIQKTFRFAEGAELGRTMASLLSEWWC